MTALNKLHIADALFGHNQCSHESPLTWNYLAADCSSVELFRTRIIVHGITPGSSGQARNGAAGLPDRRRCPPSSDRSDISPQVNLK